MTTQLRSETSHSLTTGDGRPAEARIAFVTNSETISSVVSANAARPHSLTTCLACIRAHGTADSRARSSSWLRTGQDAVAACAGLESGPDSGRANAAVGTGA